MKTFNYDKFSAIKADLENTKEALKNVSQQMVEQFVELIDTACEVYQAIPKSEVPTEKSEEAIRNLLVKITITGIQTTLSKVPQLCPYYKNPNNRRSLIFWKEVQG